MATAVPVQISTVDPESDPDDGRPFFRSAEETTANLSLGGAFVRSWEPLAPGRRVVVTVDGSPDGTLQLVGRVVWTRRELRPSTTDRDSTPGYGIEFVETNPVERAALARLLHRIASTQPDARRPSAPAEAPAAERRPAPGGPVPAL